MNTKQVLRLASGELAEGDLLFAFRVPHPFASFANGWERNSGESYNHPEITFEENQRRGKLICLPPFAPEAGAKDGAPDWFCWGSKAPLIASSAPGEVGYVPMQIKNLAKAYEAKADEELLQLATESEQLTPEAKSAPRKRIGKAWNP